MIILIKRVILQYCGKVMRANFDEFHALFSLKFLENLTNCHLKFPTFEISRKLAKIRKIARKIEETNFRRSEISTKFGLN